MQALSLDTRVLNLYLTNFFLRNFKSLNSGLSPQDKGKIIPTREESVSSRR